MGRGGGGQLDTMALLNSRLGEWKGLTDKMYLDMPTMDYGIYNVN